VTGFVGWAKRSVPNIATSKREMSGTLRFAQQRHANFGSLRVDSPAAPGKHQRGDDRAA
jgi:hypothetical protein